MSKEGYNITIGIKETLARDIINDVVINQDELLRESGQLNVIVLDFMEESREKIMKTLRHKKSYRVVYHGADINLTSRIIEVIEKVEDKETSVPITHEMSEENIEYLAKGILKTVVQIRKVHKWNGKLIVYMPKSEVSKAVCWLLEDIAIRSIEVNPKGIKGEQDEIGFSLEKIKEYKKRKFKTE